MFFVLKQLEIDGTTYERNVRMGGFRTQDGMRKAAIKHHPSIVRNERRETVGQTINPQLPNFISG